ncbi:unnamed protein product [Kuraishia capsulata CBS 1993]|uniref:tRNA:m(4)X modification enzyme TRM13 n=1 Tax=Kuraishia capsulata CBS 1993 TaxID=1382522 RepID=W6MLY6_9ASCO|nr:uncharacterized protein KUCA_T00003479001 [Kuraishia capsulata CBS 1993]CDK27501.1 unnamed protein product [Kuraishia capsulata CBS 1993]
MKERLQCTFYIEAKKRHCGMTRHAANKFCSEHLAKSNHSPTVQVANGLEFKRVPCPVDPKHTVWEHKLAKHVQKCSSLAKPITASWFELDCNSCKVTDNVLKGHPTDEEFVAFVEKLEKIYEVCGFAEIPLEQLTYEKEGLQERFEILKESNQKHVIQQSSMIQHLEQLGALSDSELSFVEFGCGRAELSYYLSKVLQKRNETQKVKTQFLLVDRGNPRMKFDHKMRESGINARRVKVDIKDLIVEKALREEAEQDTSGYFGISKHLCGVATDLTLRCVINSDLAKFRGMTIAMCCRHCCQYDQLLAGSKDYLTELGISRPEFQLMLIKMVSWATSGKESYKKGENTEHFTGRSIQERFEIGLKARRIVDESRLRGLRNHGLVGKLVRYVSFDTSPENCLLIVGPKTG